MSGRRGVLAAGARAAAVGLVVLLAACAAPREAVVVPDGAATTSGSALPDPVRVADVPFVAQPDWQCGPASLAMVMAAAGRPVPVATLAADSFTPGLQGALQAEVLAAPRRHGLLATVLPPTLDALRTELADGRPVVVLQNLGLAALPRWHYAVVIGIDVHAGEATLHSGDTASMPMRLSTFERTWARGGRWAIAVTPPSRLPASSRAPQAVQAAIGLERVDASAAGRAWDAIVERWPADRLGRFGRANLALARGDARAAAADYRAALATDPAFADAWNNLAQALEMLGDGAAARDAADRAIAIGGPRVDAYRDTRAALDR